MFINAAILCTDSVHKEEEHFDIDGEEDEQSEHAHCSLIGSRNRVLESVSNISLGSPPRYMKYDRQAPCYTQVIVG